MNASDHEAETQEVCNARAHAPLVLVVNRKARGGDVDLASIVAALGSPRILDLADPADLPATLEAECTDDVERVVVAGGDGTINSALQVIVRTGKTLGIIPLGTANDLARTLNIPLDPMAAVDVIVRGHRRRVDVASVNGRYFLNAAGLGFSVGLGQDLTSRVKGLFGPFAYGIGVLRGWRKYSPFSVFIHGEGIAVRRRVIQVTVANGRFYGGGMTAHQGAQIDDGMLDIVMVLHRPLWRHASSAIRLKRGVYAKNASVVAERAARFELTTHQPKPVSVDGESGAFTPASFDVLPGALEVYVPDDSDQE